MRVPRSGAAQRPVALVTGANRGIGLEVCRQLAHRQYTVVLGSRDPAKGEGAAHAIDESGLSVLPYQLDVTDLESIERARAWLAQRLGRLDVLVNNAAVLYDTWQSALTAELGQVRAALDTNTFGAWNVVRAFLPLLRRSPHPRVVNVSSEAGSLATMDGGAPAYRLSKAALNALTRMLASELREERILVNAVCPGWVATDMGGSGGRPVSEGAAGVVWAATLPDDGPTGGFFRDGRRLEW
jgi:NAD(P)-dependent dehydrogenase (short-subunit alcohol dehydrogenase family)